MKRILLTAIFILSLAAFASVHAQVETQNARSTPVGSGAPSGACISGPLFGSDYTDTSTTPPTIYKCKSSAWVATAGGGASATRALDNLSAVNINTSLLAQTGVDAGSTTKPFRNFFMFGSGTYATTYIELTGTPTGTRVLTLPDTTDTLVGKATSDELTNKTLTSSVGKGTWTASGTWTLPAFTLGGTVSGGGQQLNNVIIGTSTPLAGSFTTVSGSTSLTSPIHAASADGTTSIKFTKADGSTVVGVWDTTNTRLRVGSGVAPTVPLDVTGAALFSSTVGVTGALTAASVNGNTITTGTGTLTLGAAKVATISNTLTFTGTDSSSVAFGTGGTVAYTDVAQTFTQRKTITNTTSGTALVINTSVDGSYGETISSTAATNNSYGLQINAGTSASDWPFIINNKGGGTEFFRINGAGAILLSTNVTNAAGTPGSLCYNTGTFEMTKNNALTCTVSSRRFKQNIQSLPRFFEGAGGGADFGGGGSGGLWSSAFDRLRPVRFVYNDHLDRERIGFISEEAGDADKRFADGYDENGKNPTSLDQNAILAATVAEVQNLKHLYAAQNLTIVSQQKEITRLQRQVKRMRSR